MNRKILLLFFGTMILMSACGKQNIGKKENVSDIATVTEKSNSIVIYNSSKIKKKNASFRDPFVSGNLNYKVIGCDTYETLQDAKVERDMIQEPYNVYSSNEVGQKYQKISDFVSDDGRVTDSHVFLVLNIRVQNKDAVGIEKKNEFTVSSFSLRGGDDVNQYNISYFSDANKVNADQPLHYKLEQGKSIDFKLGYFVQKEDLKNLVGVISDSDVQFSIK
jgi:hypothetical protein